MLFVPLDAFVTVHFICSCVNQHSYFTCSGFLTVFCYYCRTGYICKFPIRVIAAGCPTYSTCKVMASWCDDATWTRFGSAFCCVPTSETYPHLASKCMVLKVCCREWMLQLSVCVCGKGLSTAQSLLHVHVRTCSFQTH